MLMVELKYWELFDEVSEQFDTVEEALLRWKKIGNKRATEGWMVPWGGEYRFKEGEKWSEWKKIS